MTPRTRRRFVAPRQLCPDSERRRDGNTHGRAIIKRKRDEETDNSLIFNIDASAIVILAIKQ